MGIFDGGSACRDDSLQAIFRSFTETTLIAARWRNGPAAE
jgi:hypothetical protein